MRKERRWTASAIKEAARTTVAMPWTRGERRQAFTAKRDAAAARRTARG